METRLGYLVFALDLKTHYWLCGPLLGELTSQSFAGTLCTLIYQHVLRVCDLSKADSVLLAQWVHIALDPWELIELGQQLPQAPLRRSTNFVLELLADEYPLPNTSVEWFEMSLPFNRQKPRADTPCALEQFQSFWLGLLQYMLAKQAKAQPSLRQNNVLPFRPRK